MDQMKIAIFALTVSSVLGKVKCDSGELMSTCILIILVFVAFFAAIGWWSRRNENK